MNFVLHPLPVADSVTLETKAVLRQCARAHRHLAELKGIAASIPNESILIDTLALQEAKDSSAIENIITTQDELFRAEVGGDPSVSPAAKEVQNYTAALTVGFQRVRGTGLIRLEDILEVQATLEQNRAGLRKLPGTVLKNQQTGEVIYEPPQDAVEVERLMNNLIAFLNDETMADLDPLVKMAVIHYQFESIHPFYDGNGRTGRILNLLYLVTQGLMDIPILYLSRYIIRTKADYYRHLQTVRTEADWEGWLLYLIRGVEETSRDSVSRVVAIRTLMQQTKHDIRERFPKIYSQDLLNNLFRHPYTKIEFIERDLGVSRPTATKYLEQLAAAGVLKKQKMGRTNYFINEQLFTLLTA